MATATVNMAPQQELTQLRAAMLQAQLVASAAIRDLQREKNAKDARAARRQALERAISARQGEKGLSGVARRRRHARERDLGGSEGAASFERGRVAEIVGSLNDGLYSSMLERLAYGVIVPGSTPEAALADPVQFQALSAELDRVLPAGDNLILNPLGHKVLDSMRASVQGDSSAPVAFNRAEWDATAAGDLARWKSRAPNSNFFAKLGRETGRVVSQLDANVPGWSILLDVATPVLPISPLLTAILSALPVAGGIAKAVATATPLLGGGSGFALSPSAVVSELSPLGAPAEASIFGLTPTPFLASSPLESVAQQVSQQLGAVKFTLTKSAAQSAAQNLGVTQAFEKLGSDLLDGYVLAAELVALFLDPGVSAEFELLSAALTALKTAIGLTEAFRAADALKKAAARAKAAALAQARADEASTAALEAELARLEGRLAGMRAPNAAGSSGVGKLAAALFAAFVLSEVFA